MFVYIVGELASLNLAIETLTGINALPFLIVEAAVTTIYTSWGGFRTSFITDTVQSITFFCLILVITIAVATQFHIDHDVVVSSGLLDSSKLGWQLIWILPAAVATNAVFLSGYWLRTFASRSDRDLLYGCILGFIIIFISLMLIGSTGLLAVWANLVPSDGPDTGNSFFYVLLQLPSWVIGITLVFLVSFSCSAFDSFQSSMVSSISNDVFRNRLRLVWVRGIVIVLMAPTIVVALKVPNIFQMYLISELICSAVVPGLLLGISSKFYFLTGWEVIISGLGGIISVFIYGAIYYGSAFEGAQLLIVENGLYAKDWSAFGAFLCAPGGGIIFGAICLAIRLFICYVYSRVKGTAFTALDRPKNRFKYVRKAAYDPTELFEGSAGEEATVGVDDDSKNEKMVLEKVTTRKAQSMNKFSRFFDEFFEFDTSTREGRIKNMFFIPYSEKSR